MDNMTDEQINNNHTAILTKLSDIDKNLAVNTNETQNIKTRIADIQTDMKEAKIAIQIANGRTTKLEGWSNEAKKIIEATTKTASDTLINYKSDRTKILAGSAVILFLGGTILTLAIMAINSKIKDGINEALSAYEITK